MYNIHRSSYSLFSSGPNLRGANITIFIWPQLTRSEYHHQEDQWLYVTLRHFRRFCCLYKNLFFDSAKRVPFEFINFASVHVYSENSGLQSSIIFALQSLIPTEKWHLHVDDFSNCLRFIIHHLRSSRQTVLFE